MVQPLRAATGYEVDRSGNRPRHATGSTRRSA